MKSREQLEQEIRNKVGKSHARHIKVIYDKHDHADVGGFLQAEKEISEALCNLFEQEMKEKDEQITNLSTDNHKKHLEAFDWKNYSDVLQQRIQQLESEKEERGRKAFEAAREVVPCGIFDGNEKYPTYESYKTLHP